MTYFIPIVGTHCSGKTTLAEKLTNLAQKKGYNAMFISEVARDCPFPMHEGQTEEATQWILEEQKKSEKDNLRTQLLVMMNLMSDNKEEIMTCAERYFKELKGDWFYSSLFKKWLKDNNVEPPIWFIEK